MGKRYGKIKVLQLCPIIDGLFNHESWKSWKDPMVVRAPNIWGDRLAN